MPPIFLESLPAQPPPAWVLSEATAKHVAQVLRMAPGDRLRLTNGAGLLAEATVSSVAKKSVAVSITASETLPDARRLHLAVGFTKNAARNEWLLEKAAELGAKTITPLTTERSNRERIRAERWHTILASAMLQSGQCHLTKLEAAVAPAALLSGFRGQALLAHCREDFPRIPLAQALSGSAEETLILIGPEGDFSPAEITSATAAGAISIQLGNTRLRTETAAMAACAAFHLFQSNA